MDRVQCSACNAENREGRRFCAQCGAALSAPCPSRGFANEPDERFRGGRGGRRNRHGPAGAWDEVERHAQALEAYMSAEPLPWCTFYIARGRALAAAGSEPSDAALAELGRPRVEAKAKGLLVALPALEQAPAA